MVTAAPRIRWVPGRDTSLGPAAVAFARAHGLTLDAHQEGILDAFMGRDERGRWVTFENAVCEPRQCGKTEALLVRLLFGAFELRERHVVYSAHMWATAHEAFLRALDLVESSPELSGRVAKVRRSAAISASSSSAASGCAF
jgi:hypothetical protein